MDDSRYITLDLDRSATDLARQLWGALRARYGEEFSDPTKSGLQKFACQLGRWLDAGATSGKADYLPTPEAIAYNMRPRIVRLLERAGDEGLTLSRLKAQLGPSTSHYVVKVAVDALVESGEALWGTQDDTMAYLLWKGQQMVAEMNGTAKPRRRRDRSNGPRGAKPAFILWLPDYAPPHVVRRAQMERDGLDPEYAGGDGCTCWDHINAEFPEGHDEHCPTHGHQDNECPACDAALEATSLSPGVRLPPFPS